jgi:hypothetical protein
MFQSLNIKDEEGRTMQTAIEALLLLTVIALGISLSIWPVREPWPDSSQPALSPTLSCLEYEPGDMYPTRNCGGFGFQP